MTPRWQVETTEQFDRDFKKLDQAIQRRVMASLEEVEKLDDPRQRGKGLTANHTGVWRYRVGDHRILAQIIGNSLTVLTLNVDHRKDVY
ncbi:MULTISPECIES: type II toxin-antitoxin system RelE/ParE family toxin [unclassified Cryobacterium]|uniref:type II toxin-antitoxin system RelE family toxin n=1 Tax=unclassified Cryobacterium TaxID=2649013 RepID=UPI000CE4CB9E|nr:MULTISPECIES: type II toxin-antitoxin system RelE/ParE family toxin [unclassified Cryobacterium]